MAWRIRLLLVLATIAFLLPMFAEPYGIASGDAFRDNDWLNCRSFDLLSRQAMLEHGQFPLRSHLLGGGFPVIAHPSDGSWAPTILAVLLLGDVLGVKLNLLLLFVAGALGVYALARRWLGLERPASVLSALALVFSAWAPSMLLSGFYHQAFYLLVPGVLYLLLRSPGRPDRLLWSGLLLFWIFQQGGHAFAATAYFLGVVIWLVAARDSAPDAPARPWTWWIAPLVVALLLCSSLAVSRGLRLAPHLWGAWSLLIPAAVLGAVALWAHRSARLRGFGRSLLPWAGRLSAVLATSLALGAARVVGMIYLAREGEYHTGLNRMRYWFLTDRRDESWIERFYEGPGDFLGGLLGRVPRTMQYMEFHGRAGGNLDYEYIYLGLTALVLLLAVAGLVLGRRQRRVGLLAVGGVLFSLICAGWFVPPDFHFLLVWGLPWAGELSQPIKYYNFFLLLLLVLSAGVGAHHLAARLPAGGRARLLVTWGALAVLIWPFVQNRPILGELFARPRPAPARERFHQLAMVSRAALVGLPPSSIRSHNEADRLRDYRRPAAATEYHNIRRNVGTVDWYGTVLTREDAIPSHYLTPEGQRLINPGYRGEAWLQQGHGQVLAIRNRPNTIELQLHLTAPDTLVVNQSYLHGFHASVGVLQKRPGLMRVRFQSAGNHHLRLTYHPPHFIAGLALSALALLAWITTQLFLWRRRR